MSDFPFSIPRRVDTQTPPFSYIQTTDNTEYDVVTYNGNNEVLLTKLSGLKITPNSESQVVLLQLHLFGEWDRDQHSASLSFKRVVGGVETWLDTRDLGIGGRKPVNGAFAITFPDATNNSTPQTLNVTLIDVPNTTQEITYDLYLINSTGSPPPNTITSHFNLNRTVSDTANTYNSERGISTLTAECKG